MEQTTQGPSRRVSYIHSLELLQAADALPANPGRASLVHHLIDSFDLLENENRLDASRRDDLKVIASKNIQSNKARVVEPLKATREMLTKFHDTKYIGALLGKDETESDSDSDSDTSDSGDTENVDDQLDISAFRLAPLQPRRGSTSSSAGGSETRISHRKRRRLDAAQLVDDCPIFNELPEYVSWVAGASIQAARELRDGKADVAIAWTGGRHHGKRGTAAGFCYINDIVLAIQELRSPPRIEPPPSSSPRSDSSSDNEAPQSPSPNKISRVLYLDLDLHHGDGVESAFFTSPYVLTLSVHLHAPLFFPSTGSLASHGPPGSKPASYHALNLALEPGLSSSTLLRLFESSIDPIFRSFAPDAVVVQCGIDGLQGDPCAEWNLSCLGMGEVVRRVIEDWGKKTLLLGGGGYDNSNAARCWTYLTSIALGRSIPLDSEIPSSLDSEDYELYKPSFTLDVPEGQRKDLNTTETLDKVERVFRGYKDKLDQKYLDKRRRAVSNQKNAE